MTTNNDKESVHLNILIVDDEANIRKTLRICLESRGHRVTSVKIGDHVSLKVIEENHIRRVIAFTKALQESADILGIDQATLWHKRKQYGI